MATTVAASVSTGAPEDTADELISPDARHVKGPWYGDGLAPLLAGGLAFMAAGPIGDNSLFTHLATGRVMLGDGFPTANPFLYSSTDFPIPSWWWSGVLGLVDALAGGNGIRLLTVILAAALGALIVRLARPPGGPEPTQRAGALSIVLPVSCAFITLMPFLNARPQLPAFLLLGLTVLVVRERRSPWWLVPVFATWVNVHGTWFYGFLVLALLVGCEVIDRRRIERRGFALAGAAGLGALVGGVLYPDRLRLLGLPFEQFGDERARRALSSYQEWAPSGWTHPLTWILLAMGLVAVVGAVQRRSWGTMVGSLALVAMGLSAGRLLPLAAITLVPWVASGLADVGGVARPVGRVARLLAGLGVVLLAVGTLWAVATPAYDLSRYPVAAVDWLSARGMVAEPDVKVASHDYVGNYLELRYGARANTLVDDRSGVDATLDYTSMLWLRRDWRQALGRADPDVIIWESDELLTRELARSAEFVEAGTFKGFTVFCRRPIADRCR